MSRVKASNSYFEEWSQHPITRALIKTIALKYEENALELCQPIPFSKGVEHTALADTYVRGMQAALASFKSPEHIKEFILEDKYVEWED